MEKGLFPYSRFYLGDVYRRFGCYWANHFNTIGLIGMNETLLNFAGCDLASAQGQALAQEVLNFMRGRLVDFQEETGQLFLEATPAGYALSAGQGVSFDHHCQNGKASYYTNSTQLPVGYTDDLCSP